MKNQELFHKTIGILVNAYQKDELEHDTCSACACGNIIAKANGFKFISIGKDEYWHNETHTIKCDFWSDVFITSKYKEIVNKYKTDIVKTFWGTKKVTTQYQVTKTKRKNSIHLENITDEFLEIIKPTGYSVLELAKIENDFEIAKKGNSNDEYMFNGLMNVVDALMQIHEATTEEIKDAKSLFVKELAV